MEIPNNKQITMTKIPNLIILKKANELEKIFSSIVERSKQFRSLVFGI
jgi:hypothetical protein